MAKLKIDVHDLHKYYGENEVLKGISTKFYEGMWSVLSGRPVLVNRPSFVVLISSKK
ncbi:Glutamate transport ATP-binding protein [Streptococcus sp. ZB199]|nr:Glutamate transport ATP-binding protein [Streptococcus sp. ZB199]